MGRALLASTILAATASAPVTASAEMRAVIVGIDQYDSYQPLRGAVNDADDLHGVMLRRGVTDVTILRDGEATRKAYVTAMDGLVDRSKPGDFVLISFAGHGATEHWSATHPADVQEGDAYQSFLLSGFSPPTGRSGGTDDIVAGYGERILGREMRVWLKALNDRGAQVLFVADSCYSGGMTRKLAKGSPDQTFRFVPPFPTAAEGTDPLTTVIVALPPDQASEFFQLREMPKVTFLAAVDRKTQSPEFEIPEGSGVHRGALSFSVARALEGQADTDKDGLLTRKELYLSVGASVRQISQHRQLPELQPTYGSGSDRDVVFAYGNGMQQVAQNGPPASRLVRVFVDGDPGVNGTFEADGDYEIETTTSRDEADYVWTPATGRVVSSVGDEIANGIGPGDIADVAEREIARRDLVELSRNRPMDLHLSGDKADRLYRDGERVGVVAETGSGEPRHYVMFNVAGDGTVQFLYPMPGDPKTFEEGQSPFGDINVQPPFGGDLLVLVTDAAPLDPLIDAIVALDGRRTASKAVEAVRLSETNGMRLATQGLFTSGAP